LARFNNFHRLTVTINTVFYFRKIDPKKTAITTEVITVTKPGTMKL
jgi:hypothetical protein